VIWARGNAVSTRCPKSVITAESLHYLELFSIWKQSGGGELWQVDAKTADALLVLAKEYAEEKVDENT
jgi:hypothetical protein